MAPQRPSIMDTSGLQHDLFPSFDEPTTKILQNLFRVQEESRHPLCKAFIQARILVTWSELKYLSPQDIHDLEYWEGNQRVPLRPRFQRELHLFIAFGIHFENQGKDWHNHSQYIKEDFEVHCAPIISARRRSVPESIVTAQIIMVSPTRDYTKARSRPTRKSADVPVTPPLPDDLKSLFLSFDSELACILHTTLNVTQEAHNHLCEALIAANLKSWDRFVTSLPSPVQVAYPEYCGQNGLAAIQNRATSNIPLSIAPRESADVSTIPSTPVSHPSPSATPVPPPTPVHPTVDNPETPTGLPGSSNSGSAVVSTSTGTPSYTWKYFPSTDSVRFRKVASSSTPSIVHTDITSSNVPTSKPSHEPHSTPNSRWTFYPQSETVVFHRTRKSVSFSQPTCIPSLQLPPSGASSKDSVVPSSVHAYSQHEAPSCPVWKPLYGAHSMIYDSPAVSITKRHRDAIKLKRYHLHGNLLFANWLYDDVT
eukprot:jgi/Psemu1/11253/gm1.11253_g